MELNTTKVTPSETLEQYLWRLGNNKDTLGLMWSDIANLINKAFQSEDNYLTESAYRKKYAAAKQFYDEVFSKDYSAFDTDQETLRKIARERQKLRDERVAYNKQNRDAARLDENFDYLASKLQEIGRINFAAKESFHTSVSNKDLIVCLSDLHIGTEYYSSFGMYSPEIAEQRLDDYLTKIIEIGKMHGAENVYLCALGDLINGALRITVQLSNRENVVEQIQHASELIASFCATLAENFSNVYVTGVSGNHSRLVQNKDDAQKDERADKLVLWIVQQMLGHISNIHVATESLDTTIAIINVRGKLYTLAHGDYDKPTDAGIGKLITMIGCIPYAIICGHRHSMAYQEMNGIRFLQAGSLCGGGGDYETQCRLTGKPNQTVLVVDENGIDAIYNVELK